MKYSLLRGFSFGLTSGVITTLGLMVGLYSGTHSTLVVIGGILSIAVSDAFSDALGIHVSEEASGTSSVKDIWLATFATFISKFVFALTFVIPVLLFSLQTAILISIVWGIFLIAFFSIGMAKKQGNNPWHVVREHVSIMLLVVGITYFVGKFIAYYFV